MNYKIINVVDIEATCWDEHQQQGISEIIEIGISQLEIRTGNILRTYSIYVKPKHSKVSKFCHDLTGITQEYLDKHGTSFPCACDIMEKSFNTRNHVWASYGNYDKKMFAEQCKKYNIRYPLSYDHINIKTLYTLKNKLNKGISMDKVLENMGIPLEGRHHCGRDDAYNTAKILRE